MKRYVISILFLTAVSLFHVFSQNVNESDIDEVGYYTEKAKDNWYVSVGGGLQMYVGTDDLKYFSTGNFSPAVDFSFGKWVAPSLGFRVQLAGLQGSGWSSTVTPYIMKNPVSNLYKELFLYFNGRVDLMWDVLNMGNNYKYSRAFHLIPFIGAGAVATYSEGVGKEIGPSGTAGLLFSFRCSEHISVYLELRSTFADGRMDKVRYGVDAEGVGYEIPPAVEFMNTASIGLQFNISPKKFVRRYEMTSDYRYQIMQQKNRILELQKKIISTEEKVKERDNTIYELIKENDKLIEEKRK